MFVNGAASVEQRERVSQRSVGNFCYQRGGVFVESDILMLGDSFLFLVLPVRIKTE